MTIGDGETGPRAAWQWLLEQSARDSAALAVGLFDASGVMIEGNRGLRRLLCDHVTGDDCSNCFENPDFADLWRRAGADGGFLGLLSLGDRKRINRSIVARVHRVEGLLQVVGEVDVVELDQINGQFVGLNQTVNDLRRELLRKNRRLEQALAAITRKERLLTALDEINRAIRECETEQGLLQRVCDITVASGGFKLATACRPDQDRFAFLSAAGNDAYLKRLRLSTDPTRPEGGSLTALAYRSGQRWVSNDYLADPTTAPWHDLAREHGVAAAAAEPITDRRGVCAVLQVCAGSVGYFGNDELEILGRIADEVGLALEAISDRKALSRSEERYRYIFESAPIGLVQYDPDGTIVDCNDAYAGIVGSPRGRIVGLNLLRDLKDQRVINAVRESLTRGQSQIDLVYRSVTADKVTPVRGFFSAVRAADGSLLSGIGMVEDFSERHQLERELRRGEERFRLAVDAAGIGVWEYDLRRHRLRWDAWMRRLHGLTAHDSPSDLAGWRRLLQPEDRRQVTRRLGAGTRSNTTVSVEFRVRVPQGELRYLHLYARLLAAKDDDSPRFMGVCLDITDQRLADQQIRRLAFYDPLTKLANRRLLIDRLEHSLARCRREHNYGALLLLDLDGFKAVNDSQGHDVGDELLVELAERLRGGLRGVDTIARLGGDEFVVLAEGLGSDSATAGDEAAALTEKVLMIARRPYLLPSAKGQTFHCGASVGFSVFDDCQAGPGDVMKQADIAMFEAKRAGRNRICRFRPSMLGLSENR